MFGHYKTLCMTMKPKTVTSFPVETVSGDIEVPGDKSVSHRALLFGALAVGETRIRNLLESADVLATMRAIQMLDATVERDDRGFLRVYGCGTGGLGEPDNILDMGNSGTSARLLTGILAGQPFTTFLSGDASLNARPMQRVMAPLVEMGARFTCRRGGLLPMAISGSDNLLPIVYRLPVASAQVKSCVLLAGLHAAGETSVVENVPTRDHTERLLRTFGATVDVVNHETPETTITIKGHQELTPADVAVPGDISSAAFPIAAAACLPGSDLTVRSVGTNPRRCGLIETLREMGADIAITPVTKDDSGHEPLADIRVKGAHLQGVEVPAERAPSMIDEFPVLSVVAACADGQTGLHGLSELRFKESDRLSALVHGLQANGIEVQEHEDGVRITGCGGRPPGGGLVTCNFDHRIAMSFLVLGLFSNSPVVVDDTRSIETSFPDFETSMQLIGAVFKS